MSELRIGNIKGSFTYKGNSELNLASLDQAKQVKRHRNFVVLRLRFVYIIFQSSGYVNVTKIRNVLEIKDCLEEFREVTGISQHSKFRIHNIHAFGKLSRTLNLHQSHRQVAHKAQTQDIIVSFNPSLFHGMKIRVKDLGTFVLFQSGNYSLLGSRSLSRLQKLATTISTLLPSE